MAMEGATIDRRCRRSSGTGRRPAWRDTLDRLTCATARTLEVEHVAIVLRRRRPPRVPTVIAVHGDPGLVGRRLSPEDGLAGRVIATGRSVVMADESRAAAAVPVEWGGRVSGALLAATAGGPRRFSDADLGMLTELAGLASSALDHAATSQRLALTLREGTDALAGLLDLRDGYTSDHSDDVSDLAMRVAAQLGLKRRQLEIVAAAARLHDLGKIGVPDRILRKRGPLENEEWQIMRCHPDWGAKTIERVPGLREVARAVRYHHERWDGGGYPAGLSGHAIPIASRVISACDAFSALVSDRPYRRAVGRRHALVILSDQAGAQFDPRVIDALHAVVSPAAVARAPSAAHPAA